MTEYYQRTFTNKNEQDGNSSAAPTTSVNQDFLIALQSSGRVQVLEFEAEFQARQERNYTPASGNNGAGAGAAAGTNNDGSTAYAAANAAAAVAANADMDTAAFFATLSADFREDIVVTSGETVIVANVTTEVRVLRERQTQTRLPCRVARRIDPYNSTEVREFGHGRSSSDGLSRIERAVPNELQASSSCL